MAKKYERATNSPTPPEEGTRGYERVLSRGCGGYKYESSCGTEYDCHHDYGWSCDDCPIVTMQIPDEEGNGIQGPPATEFYRKHKVFWIASVDTEF